MRPVRIQRKRTKGYNMQSHSQSINGLDCVYVGRPSKWGNPYVVGKVTYDYSKRAATLVKVTDRETACELFEKIAHEFHPKSIKDLRGKNIACWCPLDQPCHADILLRLANEDN